MLFILAKDGATGAAFKDTGVLPQRAQHRVKLARQEHPNKLCDACESASSAPGH